VTIPKKSGKGPPEVPREFATNADDSPTRTGVPPCSVTAAA
jgi:hypothetical protein